MDAPPQPEVDEWIGSLEQDLGGYSPAPVSPPADTPGGGEPVIGASGAVGATAPPEAATERPVAGTAGRKVAPEDLWLEQVEAHVPGSGEKNAAALPGEDKVVSVLAQQTNGFEKQLDALLTRAVELASLRERLNQVDELSSRTAAQFDALQKSRADLETFHEEIHAFHTSRADIMKATAQLGVDRTAFEGFVQRVDDFQRHIPGLDAKIEAVTATLSKKTEAVSVLGQKTDGLETRVDTLQRKQTDLESLQDRLNQVDELSSRTGAQFDALQKNRADLETFQEEIHAFHTSRADIMEAAEGFAVDRTAFEAFVQRVDDFQRHIPGLDSKIEAITATLSKKTEAVSVLGQKTDGLDTRVDTLQQKQTDLESLQDRLTKVDELSSRTAAQFDALQKNRADLETFQGEIHAFHTSRADIMEAAGGLAVDRTAFEAFVQRVDDFQRHIPGLDSKIEAITATLSKKTEAVSVLGQKTDGLETRVDTLQQKQTDLESLQDRLNQVDDLSSRTGAQFAALQKNRADLETFQEEIHAFHTSRADIMEAAEQLAVDRTAFEGFVQRVDDFQQRVPGLDAEMDTLSAKWSLKKKAVTAWGKKTDGLERRLGWLLTQAAALQEKQTDLESLQERLNQVDALLSRTGAQYDVLQKSRVDLEVFQAEVHALHTSRAEIAEAAERFAADRTAFEGFVQRVDDFRQRLPGLESKMDAIAATAATVDQRRQQISALVALSADLDLQVNRIKGHKQDVDTIAARLDTLNSLSDEVDRKLEQQLGRRTDVESLTKRVDELSNQMASAGLQTSTSGDPLRRETATLEARVEKVEDGLRAADRQETEVVAQSTVADLMDPSRTAAPEREEPVSSQGHGDPSGGIDVEPGGPRYTWSRPRRDPRPGLIGATRALAVMSTLEPNPPDKLVSVSVREGTPVSCAEARVPTPELSRPDEPVVMVAQRTPPAAAAHDAHAALGSSLSELAVWLRDQRGIRTQSPS